MGVDSAIGDQTLNRGIMCMDRCGLRVDGVMAYHRSAMSVLEQRKG